MACQIIIFADRCCDEGVHVQEAGIIDYKLSPTTSCHFLARPIIFYMTDCEWAKLEDRSWADTNSQNLK